MFTAMLCCPFIYLAKSPKQCILNIRCRIMKVVNTCNTADDSSLTTTNSCIFLKLFVSLVMMLHLVQTHTHTHTKKKKKRKKKRERPPILINNIHHHYPQVVSYKYHSHIPTKSNQVLFTCVN